MKNLIYCTISFVLINVLYSCGFNSEEVKAEQEKVKSGEIEYYDDNFISDFDCDNCDINIVKVRDCEYVFWHNGYGSDMEHYADCNNPNHKK